MPIARPYRVEEPIVQVSLDLTNIEDALAFADVAVRAGVDWLEAGTPLILGEGLHAVRALHEAYPENAVVADLKTMDGGYLEAEMMAQAGASWVVVMGVAHPATIRAVVKAGEDYGVGVMGDIMAADDPAACALRLEELGADVILVHTSYDARKEVTGLSPLDDLQSVVDAVSIPIQAVGGLSVEQAVAMPSLGAPLIVLGAPLVIDAHEFSPAASADELERLLSDLVKRAKATPMLGAQA
ncbi:D-arabino 3-hexulose 6-phosphate aldehyde lyase [Candidatus Poribacteria bacterium]|jgi:3-hexulose-6-phosphate synthase|nr:D-arabino 3-hexulose 6-phosphate aldehyde lyase [Candidatus Poribacteria bacterium]MBT5532562.1 D-arabino 3-hexulose 6-phosphate aldehyde lyase [Candidatus Poribacteria bacterium]MBT5715034.1 D-arabino 3-hexulose 6-phosphate aldehyde lyase [Candidatus Poribacteria bacterium]MBT7099943.1 D-arabino 3-hexulose 6-phosphate aldehyde lyase [Candidatus Poribacteria bacterium]MBT7805865.1 D-arabino 3-hexulose 6-phosphate aldehyde lyase [Candidatus Poribacteria bacterium]